MSEYLLRRDPSADVDVRSDGPARRTADRCDSGVEPPTHRGRRTRIFSIALDGFASKHGLKTSKHLRGISASRGSGASAHFKVVDTNTGSLRSATIVYGEHAPGAIDRNDDSRLVQYGSGVR
jgi:hypothetical protein